MPYKKWIKEYNKEFKPSFYLFATTGTGTFILQIS